MNHRAFSLLRVKAADDDAREITGTATSPTIDRVGDSIDPLGMRYRSPMPLLLYHDHTKPVGQVWFDRATTSGITFRAKLPQVDDAGTVQDRVNEAWHSLKHKLIGAVSVGFRVLPGGVEPLDNGGLRFTQTECMELSLCAIPANPDAVITGVKFLDDELRAVHGTTIPPREAGCVEPGATDWERAVREFHTSFEEAEQAMDTDRMLRLLNSAQRPIMAREYRLSARELKGRSDRVTGLLAAGWARAALENMQLLSRLHSVNRRLLEQRIEALESREKQFRYRGTFQRADSYSAGNMITHDGSMWIALRDDPGRPGDGDGWQLAVRKGRDA